MRYVRARRGQLQESESPDGREPRLHPNRLADELVVRLQAAGVTHAFGVGGGAIAVFMDALRRGGVKVVHCRHEGGAAFAATEYSLATGRPALIFTTTGPGLTNALTGLCAAHAEGARIVLVSGASGGDSASRYPFQETAGSWGSLPGLAGNESSRRVADITLEDAVSVRAAARHVEAFACAPGGGVVRILFPTSAQSRPSDLGPLSTRPVSGTRLAAVHPSARDASLHDCVELLATGSVVVWVGFGARGASEVLLKLVEERGWHVMSTPRGKGVFPENHPLYLGVTGLGGHAEIGEFLRAHRPDRTLVLGSRLGEFTSFWSPDYLPLEELVHVDVDDAVFGRAYPQANTIGIRAEIGPFLQDLRASLPERRRGSEQTRFVRRPAELRVSDEYAIHPASLMEAIQRVIAERTAAIVMVEAGNSFAWGSCTLRFDGPRYRVSTSFGAMGQATAGVVGAAMGVEGKAVAIVGDGAMLMNHEVSTAVQYGAQAVWIVLNDGKYGMVEHGMRAIGMEPMETVIPRVDFAQIARAVGAVGMRVERADDLDEALMRAMSETRPVVVDVLVDGAIPPPFGNRNASLRAQGIEVER